MSFILLQWSSLYVFLLFLIGRRVTATVNNNTSESYLSYLKNQPLAEINISIPLLKENNATGLQSFYGGQKTQIVNNKDQPILGLELFPKFTKEATNNSVKQNQKNVTSQEGIKNLESSFSPENFHAHNSVLSDNPLDQASLKATNQTVAGKHSQETLRSYSYDESATVDTAKNRPPLFHITNGEPPSATVATSKNISVNNVRGNKGRINQSSLFEKSSGDVPSNTPASIASALKGNSLGSSEKNMFPAHAFYKNRNNFSEIINQSALPKESIGFMNFANQSKSNDYDTNNLKGIQNTSGGIQLSEIKNLNSNASLNNGNNLRNTSNATKIHNLPNHRQVVESKMTSEDQEWCNKTTMDSINCRDKVNKGPHLSTSKFTGNIGVKQSNQNGTQLLGGETSNAFNETMKFKAGKSGYQFQNLTNFHNCSGCLKNKHLIHHNTTSKLETLKKDDSEGLSEISRLRNKLLIEQDRENFLVNNISRNANKTDAINNLKLSDPKLNQNTTKSGINQTLKAKGQKSEDTVDKAQTRGEIMQRWCEELDTKRNKIGKSLNLDEIITNCVTKRRLVSTKHTKTKKNGKVIGEKDEGDKSLQNADRAQANEENGKSNEERKHQSEQNDKDNAKLKLSNEKVLQEILRGDDGKPVKVNKYVDHDHDFENMTMKLDPTIIQQRLHPDEEDKPDDDHLDEGNGMMGIDERPAIEDIEDPPKKNKTNHHMKDTSKASGNKTVKTEEPKLNVTTILKDEDDKNKTSVNDKNYMKNITKIANMHKDNDTTTETASDVGSALQSNDTAPDSPFSLSNKTKEDDEKPTKRIMAFGDSLTKGLYKAGSLDKPQYNPYKIHLGELLEKEHPTKEYKIFEEGVNGECACGAMAERLSRALDERKDIDLVIIIAGTNDLLKNDCIRKCDLYEAIKKLHSITRKRHIKSVLTTILMSTFPAAKLTSKEYKDTLFDVNQRLRGYGSQQETTKQMKFCDIDNEFSRQASISFDKIHPTAKGYDVLAEILYKCIKDFDF